MNTKNLLQTITARLALLASLFALTPSGVHAALPFTPGNIVVFSADSVSTNNTTFTLLELSSSIASQSSPVNSVPINGTSGANALRTSGSASSTGYLADTADGTLIAFTGHNSTTSSGNANAILPRGVGTLDKAGNFTLQTTYTGVSGNQTRAATSLDRLTWYIGDQGGIYTNNRIANLNSANARGVKSFGGTVYVLQQSTTAAVISTLSADGSTLTSIGLAADNVAQDFYLISSGSNGSAYDVLYVVDESNATTGTIKKYSLVGSAWTANGTYATAFGGFGLCAATNGSGAAVYVTTGSGATAANSVIKLTDAAGYNATIAITTANNVTLYTAATGTTTKGIAFSPVSYTVAYDGNGNTGGTAPTDSTGYAGGATVTVLGNTGSLVKTGFTFTGWNTATNGSGTSYSPGNTFTISSNVTLYAQWVAAATYTVTYNGNGNTAGAAPTDPNSPYTSGATVTVLGNTGSLVRPGYGFAGWNTVAGANGAGYGPGDTFTISSNTTLYAIWSANPVIAVGGNPLDFGYVVVNGASPSQTYTVSGANLTAALAITPPAAFLVSTDNTTFASSLSLTPAGGTVNAMTIYVRFSPAARQIYSGVIAHTSSGAAEQDLSVSGTGANAPSVTTQPATGLASNGATLNGTVTDNGNAPVTDRGFYYKSAPGVSTSDTQASEGGTSVAPFSKAISGLNPNQAYYYRAYAVNAIGLTLDSSDTSFYTLANTPTAPLVVNPTQSSLDVAIGSGDGNPLSTTVYAIQEAGSSKYVQADGTLGPGAAFQTASAWGTNTVTGLSFGTRYTFQVKARNAAGTETPFGPATSAITLNGPITAGDLVVFSADSASANNTTFSILELSRTTTNQPAPVQIIAVNGASGDSALRTSGSATSTGYLTDSDDGTLVCFTGQNTTNSLGNANTNLLRGVGTLNSAGTFALQAAYTGGSGKQTRAAATLNDSLWYIGDQGGIYTNGSVALNTNNFRAVKSFGGTLYAQQQSSTAIVVSSLSTDGTTLTALPGLAADNTAQDFYLVSSGSNGPSFDVLYLLDSTSATAGSISKYSLASGTWTTNGSYTNTFGGFGLCAASSSGGAVLYATSGTGATAANSVIQLTDTAGFNAAIAITTTNNVTLYTALAGTTIKGIAFAPKASAPVAPTITGIQVSGGNVLIDFIAGSSDGVTNFTVLSTANLQAPLSPIAATITTSGPGHFRATTPVVTPAAFYRIRR